MDINNQKAIVDLIRHYADAIGDTNPLWCLEKYARNTRYGHIIVPPRLLDSIAPPSGMGIGFPDFGVPAMNQSLVTGSLTVMDSVAMFNPIND